MTTLTIRNLPDDLVRRLRERAERNGHSIEQEVREILGHRLAARGELLAEMKARWPEIAPAPSAPEVNGWIESSRQVKHDH
jgi:plasmid stability protein